MSALALPAAPRRWPAALAWILGLGGLAALLALQIESVQAARGVHGGFGLFQASGFRISESLLDVLPEDPYWMSLAAGLVNTLTVALAAPAPGHAAGRGAGPGAPVARSGGVAAGGRHHRAAAQHPVLLQLFVWYGLLLRLPDARQAWEPLPSVLLSIADWRCRRCKAGCRKRRA